MVRHLMIKEEYKETCSLRIGEWEARQKTSAIE